MHEIEDRIGVENVQNLKKWDYMNNCNYYNFNFDCNIFKWR